MTLEPSPFRIRKSIRELVHKPRINKSQKHSVVLPALPPHDPKTEEYAYDVLYECQRGSLAVGYSSKTLLQFDPNPWCDADMRFTPMNIENYQLPDPTWEWISKDWMIDMTEDVDEAGWQYALKFHGAVWHGNYKHFRSFVRRRRWIRLRHRWISSNPTETITTTTSTITTTTSTITTTTSTITTTTSTIATSHLNIISRLKACRLDRERMALLNEVMQSTLPDLEDTVLEKAPEYMDTFDYEDTKFKFISSLLQRKYGGSTQPELTPQEKKALQSLRFYCDLQSIFKQL